MPNFVLSVNWAGAPQLSKGLFKGFQHLLQHAFNTLLNPMFGAFEQVFQHHWKQKMWKACWKCVKSSLNWFKLSFNFSFVLENVEWSVKMISTFAQHLFNFCWMNVGQMLKPLKWTFKCTPSGCLYIFWCKCIWFFGYKTKFISNLDSP